GARGFARAPGPVFGIASLATPLFLGASAGALASGRIRVDGDGRVAASLATAWTGALSLAAAALAAAACAYLAAVYMAYEARRGAARPVAACALPRLRQLRPPAPPNRRPREWLSAEPRPDQRAPPRRPAEARPDQRAPPRRAAEARPDQRAPPRRPAEARPDQR